MGKGRKPKPIELRALQGNPGKRKMPKVLKTKSVEEDNPPPEWLDKAGKEIWRRIIKDNAKIELITANDLEFLAMYCNAHARFVEAEKKAHPAIIKTSIKVKMKKGYKLTVKYIKNPWIAIAKTYFEETEKMGSRFGFSPVDRVKTGKSLEKEDKDEIESFLNRDKA